MTATTDPWDKLTNDEARRVNMAGTFDFFWIVLIVNFWEENVLVDESFQSFGA